MKSNDLLSSGNNMYSGSNIPDTNFTPFYQKSNESKESETQSVKVTNSPKSERFNYIIESIQKILNQKNTQYKTDPIQILSTDDLLCQIKIKAVRAQLTSDSDKLEDELLDIIVYSMLTLDKIYNLK